MFGSIKDNEANKFRGNAILPKVAVTIEDGLLAGISYNKIVITYPTTTTELYDYQLNTVSQAQVKLTYTNSSKNLLSSAERL